MKTILSILSISGTLTLSAAPVTAPGANKIEMPPITTLGAMKSENVRSFMMIDPKGRVLDLQQAYDILRKEKTTAKVYFQLADGSTISNVIEMTPLNNGSMILFRYNSPQGIKLQAVEIENISGVSNY